jgi:predicted branched-subunit amino acid permease
MGFAIAPSLKAGPLRRFLTGALLTDASFVIGHREGGRFDIRELEWAAPVQYVAWVGGTVAGVVGAGAIGDPTRWGLDVLFPVFYLSLLLPELFPVRGRGRHGWSRRPNWLPIVVAVLAAVITLVLTPITPPGVPVLAAVAAALIGFRAPRRPAAEPDSGDHG